MDDDRVKRFEEVYRRNYEPILGYAIRRCELPEDASDVVAETFAIAWRRIDDVPAGEEATLWLYGVARKALANHRRGERRRRHHQEELARTIAPFFPGPEESLGLLAIIGVFRSLPEEDRELLSLLAWEGLDTAQVANVLGRSSNAVRIRLHRARKRLARALRRSGVSAHHTAPVQADPAQAASARPAPAQADPAQAERTP
ncbi:RNA polymerase sigma factor [Nonomuraea sp. 3N208]|uniref:RNA polymerase sigma factor n=1 Tax=Nonomuraea sp. 3N208 TaxID=3457421 RepID=UPI003FD529EF